MFVVRGFRYIKVGTPWGSMETGTPLYNLQNGCYSVRQRKIGVIALNAPPLPPTPLVIFLVFIFENLDCIIYLYLIVVNIQCYNKYSILYVQTLQKNIGYV